MPHDQRVTLRRLQIALDHLFHQIIEARLWRPPKLALRLARIAQQRLHLGRPEVDKLFHEIQDDRYVLETALAGRADILATADLSGFAKGPAIQFGRNDVLLFPFADRTLVVATPRFVVHWLSQGIVPDAQFIADNPKDFVRRA